MVHNHQHCKKLWFQFGRINSVGKSMAEQLLAVLLITWFVLEEMPWTHAPEIPAVRNEMNTFFGATRTFLVASIVRRFNVMSEIGLQNIKSKSCVQLNWERKISMEISQYEVPLTKTEYWDNWSVFHSICRSIDDYGGSHNLSNWCCVLGNWLRSNAISRSVYSVRKIQCTEWFRLNLNKLNSILI